MPSTTAAYVPLPSGPGVNLHAKEVKYWGTTSSRAVSLLVEVHNPQRERGGFTVRLYWEDASGRRTVATTEPDRQAFKSGKPYWGPKTGVGVSFARGEVKPPPKDARALIAVVDPRNETRETNEADNSISFGLPSPIAITGVRDTSVGSRGRIINGVFSPNGSDTKSQDRRGTEGPLSSAAEQQAAALFQAFLRGETRGNYLTGSPTAAEKKSIIDPIASRFLKGTGGTYQHRATSALAQLVKSSSSFRSLHSAFQAHVQRTLQSQASRGAVDFGALDIPGYFANPSHNIAYHPADLRVPFTLRAVLGGTQAIRITVQMKSVKPEVNSQGGGKITYSGTARYEVFDVFGANDGDRYVAALEAMWKLQHRGAKARPFINQVVVEETITGTLSVPSRYNTATVA